MNQSLLKSFAPAARIKFREAMIQRAKLLGLSATGECVPAQAVGSNVIVAGYSMPASWEEQRQKLKDRIKKDGWDKVIDEAAYTWFNRLSALRYMEVHGFIPQRVRVLTSATGEFAPEILDKAASLDFPNFKKSEIIELKMDGTKDEELYRRLLLAICEGMHKEIPLLFPSVGEAFEILLPDNLLRQGSLLEWFVNGLPDEEWQEIEVLGWLYQYYISELKSEYMGRKTAYKKEEIPAVTQLFTPKWIVQYLVHNSLGRSWLLHHPESGLKAKMPYYIEPAPQEPEVDAELKRLFSGDLNPEDIKLLDPAMGSGHILVTAYEVLREIYLERGYQRQQCARLILEKNLWGLDIDLRATEIACFALIMKAREDDPTILTSGSGLRLNLLSFRDCTGDERTDIVQSLSASTDQKADLTALLTLFEQGTLFGSLIQIPEALTKKLPALTQWLEQTSNSSELLASKAAESALVFVRLAQVLGQKYDQVVSNPPYMGTKGMSSTLKIFVEQNYNNGRSDLCTAFIFSGIRMLNSTGYCSMITMENWMFLSGLEQMRIELLTKYSITALLHMPYLGKGGTSLGINFGTCATIFFIGNIIKYNADFQCLRYYEAHEDGTPKAFPVINERHRSLDLYKLSSIPGKQIAYWISNSMLEIFKENSAINKITNGRFGMSTGDPTVIFEWPEVRYSNIHFNQNTSLSFKFPKHYAPYDKGGAFRRWYGNRENIINWDNDGERVRNNGKSAVRNSSFFCKEHLSWTLVSSGIFSARYFQNGFLLDTASNALYPDTKNDNMYLLALLNTTYARLILNILISAARRVFRTFG